MDLDILDSIYDVYSSCFKLKDIPQDKAFKEKYIDSLTEKDIKKGMEMEEMYNSALAESNVQSFKFGFKMCMYFMLECINMDL